MGKLVPFAIAQAKSGFVTNRNAYVIPEDAFRLLFNASVWRGVVHRKHGISLVGRLCRTATAVALTATGAGGGTLNYGNADILTTLRGAAQPEPNASLAPGDVVITMDSGGADESTYTDNGSGNGFTVGGAVGRALLPDAIITGISNANPAVVTTSVAHNLNNGDIVLLDGIVGMINETGDPGVLNKTETLNNRLVTVANVTATTFSIGIDTTTALGWSTWSSAGTVYPNYLHYASGSLRLRPTLVTAGAKAMAGTFNYYPALPVMGFHRHEIPNINDERAVAYDTKYAYEFNQTSDEWEEYRSAAATTWTSTDSDFVWSLSYWQPGTNTFLWTTNFTSADGIKYNDGTNWILFSPPVTGAANLLSARLLVAYRGRLVALNTIETGPTTHPQRCRFSAIGNPVAANAWRQDVAGNGGFIDCPTAEHIVTAEFIRDTLIVGFERSTWALRYSGNNIIPFYWERINKELGSECTFSKVAFDQGVLMIGERSINTCNGNSVATMNDEIPDQAYEINNAQDGRERTHGIRDFYNRMVYWCYPNPDDDQKWPNRILAFNYDNPSWSIYDDHVTAFGMWQNTKQTTWADLADITWADADFPWNSPQQKDQFVQIIVGNQQGYTGIMNPIRGTSTAPEATLQITAVTAGNPVQLTVPDHNLVSGDYLRVVNIDGFGDALNNTNYSIQIVDTDNFTLWTDNAATSMTEAVELVGAGTYLGGGEIERRQNFNIVSKKFHMLQKGTRNYLGHIDFLIDSTIAGEVTCNIYTDYNDAEPVNSQTTDNFFNTVIPTTPSQFSPQDKDKEWQRFYCTADAQFWNYELTLNAQQMLNETIVNSDVDINATIIFSEKGGRLVD